MFGTANIFVRFSGLTYRSIIIRTESLDRVWRLDRIEGDSSISRFLSFFLFFNEKVSSKFIPTSRFYPSLMIARIRHVESGGIRYPIVARMFTDPNSMKYLREERALIGRNRCLAGIIIGSLHRLELILPDKSCRLVKSREISSKLSRSREISRQKRIHREQGNQTVRFARSHAIETLVSPFLRKRIKLYSREIL